MHFHEEKDHGRGLSIWPYVMFDGWPLMSSLLPRTSAMCVSMCVHVEGEGEGRREGGGKLYVGMLAVCVCLAHCAVD